MNGYPFCSVEGWMVRVTDEDGAEVDVAGPFDTELDALEMAMRTERL